MGGLRRELSRTLKPPLPIVPRMSEALPVAKEKPRSKGRDFSIFKDLKGVGLVWGKRSDYHLSEDI